jgi:hypothetical protein
MTPKEKAFKLVAKHSRILPMNQTTLLDHKNCALIAVDEIIDILEDEGITFAEYHDKTTIEYWLEVKQEIEAL